jgi:nitrite reductase/ring-hydroxylating ferredoxin subunit
MQKIGRLSEFRDGTITKVTSGGGDMVIVRDGTSIHAFAAHCPHAGAPLEEGGIYNHRLICPWHKATFCLSDGSLVEPPALDRLARYAIEIDGDDVLVSSDLIDTPHLVGRLDRRQVLVLGSGAGGIAAAVALRDAGFERQFGPEIGAMFRRLHEANGVHFRLQAKVAAFTGTQSVDGVLLEGGERLPADLVVLGVGVSPATLFAEGVRKARDGGILVDGTLWAADGLYVVGDCACFPFNGDQIRIEHWRVAQQHGRIAAANIAGMTQHYDAVPFFWTYHFGKRFEYIGHPHGWDRIHLDGDLNDQRFIALQIQEDHVVGVIACQREHTTAVLIERMRQPLKLSEAIDLART